MIGGPSGFGVTSSAAPTVTFTNALPASQGGAISLADLQAAQRITVDLDVVQNTPTTSVIVGLFSGGGGGTFFSAGSPNIVGQTGAISFELTPGQFTGAADNFGFKWVTTPPGNRAVTFRTVTITLYR
jgi:hypothetical protein